MTAPNPAASFADPAAIGGVRPAIRDLNGRLVVITPLSIARNIPNTLSASGAVQDRITANILVCDGGPLDFGGNPAKGVPNTLRVAVPYEALGVYISQQNLVAALEPQIGKGVTLGRISQGRANNPGHNPPWNLLKVEDPQARAEAGRIFAAKLDGTLVNPAPTPIAGAITPSVIGNYQMAPTPAGSVAPSVLLDAQNQPVNAAGTLSPGEWGASGQSQPGAGALDPAYAAWLATQAQQQAPANVPPPPTGVPAEVWANFTDAQRAAFSQPPPF